MMLTYASLLLARVRSMLGSQSGQAMVEYSTITYFILIGSVATGASVNMPGTNAPLIVAFLNALNQYMTSLYFWIDMPMG